MNTPTEHTTESQNYQAIQNRLSDAKAILALLEDRDGPNGLDGPGGEDLVCYTHYENAAGVVRRMLDDLDKEVDRMDTEARRVQS